jgi:transposase
MSKAATADEERATKPEATAKESNLGVPEERPAGGKALEGKKAAGAKPEKGWYGRGKQATVGVKKALKTMRPEIRLRLKASLGMFRAVEEAELAEKLEMAEAFERTICAWPSVEQAEWAANADMEAIERMQVEIAELLWIKNVDDMMPRLARLLGKAGGREIEDIDVLRKLAGVIGDLELRAILYGPAGSRGSEYAASARAAELLETADMMSFYEIDAYPRDPETPEEVFAAAVRDGTLRDEVAKCDRKIESIRMYGEALKGRMSGKQLEEALYFNDDHDRSVRAVRALLIEKIAAATSANSNLPPSREIGRAAPQRESSDKKQGAQPGHKGAFLKKSKNVDEKKYCKFEVGELPEGWRKKPILAEYQEINVVIKTEVISYFTEVGVNPSTKSTVYPASFPSRLRGAIQYHPDVRAIVETLSVGHFIPVRRVSEIMKDMFGIGLSEGTVENIKREYSDKLEAFGYVGWIKGKLLESAKIHADETGINVGSILKWLHVASNDNLTYYHLHNNRGIEAIEECGILNLFSGILISDAFGSYDKLQNVIRCLCNAHLLRELADVMLREQGHTWAGSMRKFLLAVNKHVKLCGGVVEDRIYDRFRKRYLEILDIADRECGPGLVDKLAGTRGRQGKTKERNLIDRLRERHEDYLLFARVAEAEFSNNLAERDLRAAKIFLNVSSLFRSDRDARDFMLVRGYLSTCKKNGIGYSKAIKAINEMKLPDFIDIDQLGDVEFMARIKKIRLDKARLDAIERIELSESLEKKREKARIKEEDRERMAIAAAIKAGNIKLEEAA